jgi:tetratricopeptide (TPR) repeat protein
VREQVAIAMRDRGISFGRLGRHDEVLAAFDTVIDRFGDATEAAIRGQVAMGMRDRGFALGQLGRHDEKIAAYDALIERFGEATEQTIREQVAMGMRDRGIALGQLGRHDEKIAAYDALIERFGEATEQTILEQVAMAMRGRGIAFGELGRHEEAIEACDALIDRFGDATEQTIREQVAMGMRDRGIALGRLGRYDEEIAAFDTVIERFDESTEPAIREQVAMSMRNRGAALSQLGRTEEVLPAYDAVIERFDDAGEPAIAEQVALATYDKASAMRRAGQLAPAAETLRQLGERFGRSSEDRLLKAAASAYYEQAEILANLGDSEGAQTAFGMGEAILIRHDGVARDPGVRRSRVALLVNRFAFDDAERTLLAGTDDDSDEGRSLTLLFRAEIAIAEGRLDSASRLVELAEAALSTVQSGSKTGARALLMVRLELAFTADQMDLAASLAERLLALPPEETSPEIRGSALYFLGLTRDSSALLGLAAEAGDGVPQVTGRARFLLAVKELVAGEDAAAARHGADAARLLRRCGSPIEGWALIVWAMALRDSKPARALTIARRAVAVAERVRGSLSAMSALLGHSQRWNTVYEVAVSLALGLGRPVVGLEILALYQGRLLHEERVTRGESLADVSMYLPQEKASRLRTLRLEVARRQRERDEIEAARLHEYLVTLSLPNEVAMRAALIDAVNSPAGAAAMTVEEEYQDLVREALLFAAPYVPPMVPDITFMRLSAAVQASRRTLVSYAWTDDLHVAFVLKPGEAEAHLEVIDFERWSFGKRDLVEVADEVLARLADLNATRSTEQRGASEAVDKSSQARELPMAREAQWTETLTLLNKLLWVPLARSLGAEPIDLVPAPALGAVPFRWIAGQSGHALQLVPGPAWLLDGEQECEAGQDGGGTQDTAVATRFMFAVGGSPAEELAGVDHSLDLIEALVPAERRRVVRLPADPYFGLVSDRGHYELLFIGSHMRSDERPERAAVRLVGPDPEQAGELVTYDLSSYELRYLSCRVSRAVILAGCTSIAPSGGVDLLSLSSVIMAATGADAVLATHFSVDDLWATLLWVELLPGLQSGQPIEVALDAALDRIGSITAGSCGGYLDELRARLPGPGLESLHIWLAGRLPRVAAGFVGDIPVMPLADRAAWTILGR